MDKKKSFRVSKDIHDNAVKKFCFKIRDMETKSLAEVVVTANSVLDAKRKVNDTYAKNHSKFVILKITDEDGAQYVGKQVIKFDDESTAEELIEKSENAETVVDAVYNKYATETDKEFLKEAIKEMNRYLSNWDYMSASDKRNVGATKSELKEHIKNAEARLAQLNDSQTVQDYAQKYFKVTYKAGENVYSAVMVGANTEDEARKKFIERKPNYADKIASVTESWQGEVTSMRRRGMSVFDSSCDVKDYGEFENIEFDSPNDNLATNEVLFKYAELNGVQRRNINGMTELNFGGDWYKPVHTRVAPIGSGATYFVRMQKIRDARLNDGWSGSYNGAMYNYSNGQWTITHKNGKVETAPGDKFDTIEEVYAYIDNFKDNNEQTETTIEDAFNTSDIVNRGTQIINNMYNAKKSAHEMLESPFMKSTYFKLNEDIPKQAKAEININYEPDFDDNSRGWFIIESFIVFQDNSRTKIATRTTDTPQKAIQALKESMSKLSHSFRDSNVTDELIEIPAQYISEFENKLKQNQINIDKKGKTFTGRTHYQVSSGLSFKYFIQALETIERWIETYNIPMTFSASDNGVNCTAGIDLDKQYVKDSKEGFEHYLDVYDANYSSRDVEHTADYLWTWADTNKRHEMANHIFDEELYKYDTKDVAINNIQNIYNNSIKQFDEFYTQLKREVNKRLEEGYKLGRKVIEERKNKLK